MQGVLILICIMSFVIKTPDVLVSFYPEALKSKATGLINHLKLKGSPLRWNNKGEVFFERRKIPQSNINDLLRYALKPLRNSPRPKGIDELTRAITDVQIPHKLLSNEFIDRHLKNRDTELNESGDTITQTRKKKKKKHKHSTPSASSDASGFASALDLSVINDVSSTPTSSKDKKYSSFTRSSSTPR